MIRDHKRFGDRIKREEAIFAPVLDPAHRLKVFNERFRKEEDVPKTTPRETRPEAREAHPGTTPQEVHPETDPPEAQTETTPQVAHPHTTPLEVHPHTTQSEVIQQAPPKINPETPREAQLVFIESALNKFDPEMTKLMTNRGIQLVATRLNGSFDRLHPLGLP